MPAMDFPNSPINGQTTTDGRYYFDSSVGSTGAWRSTPLPVGGLPAGSIMAWGTNTPPANWLIADGSAVSRSVYSSLFAVIGTQYGAGDGTTTFNLPDLRGRVPVGRNAATFGTLGATGGSETNTLTANNLPAHTHPITDPGHSHGLNGSLVSSFVGYGQNSPINGNAANPSGNNTTTSATTGITVGNNSTTNSAVNNLQPYQVLNYIIKFSAGWTAGDSELATRLGVVETANATTNRAGLVPVIPSSIVVGSGSASISSSGVVTFTGASSISFNGVFTSAYTNYRVMFNESAASAYADGNLRLRSSGTDATTNYFRNGVLVDATSVSGFQSTSDTNFGNALTTHPNSVNTAHAQSAIEIREPFANKPTTIQTINGAWNGTQSRHLSATGFHSTAASYDGFTIYLSSGNFGGTFQIYGYR